MGDSNNLCDECKRDKIAIFHAFNECVVWVV